MTHDRKSGPSFRAAASSTSTSQERREEEAATIKAHRAALEALFAPKSEPSNATPSSPPPSAKRDSARVVRVAAKVGDARSDERERLVGKLLAAEGRAAVSKADGDLRKAGFEPPATQDVQLQLLEHSDEARVRAAIESLATLLQTEAPRRATVLGARLRRLEDCAEDSETRDAASQLRKKLGRLG